VVLNMELRDELFNCEYFLARRAPLIS